MVKVADMPAPRSAISVRLPEVVSCRPAVPQLLRRAWAAALLNPFVCARIVNQVVAARGSIEHLYPEELLAAGQKLSEKLRGRPLTPQALAECFILVDEALFRARGFRYHDTQLLAGLYLSAGRLVEMATGEGKTLTAALPVALHGLAGCAVHVVTVNDYLAERDAEEVRPILSALGLSVASVIHGMERSAKLAAYAADVTYCANKELVFDYLKDRAKSDELSPLSYRLQLSVVGSSKSARSAFMVRELDFVLIDEADSVLIDEANIPLILTEPLTDSLSETFLRQAMDLAREAPESFWEIDEDRGSRTLDPMRLRELIAGLSAPAPEWGSFAMAEELITQARTAQDRYHRDETYIVVEDKIVLIDPQTGRPTPDRSLPWGLQQIIEVREGIAPSSSRRTIARLSYQEFFRKYHKLSGMSGTLAEVRRELSNVYHVPIVPVATHKPVIRKRRTRRLFRDKLQKLDWAIAELRRETALGRPVLIGVSSVALSEIVSARLAQENIIHGVLNARQEGQEAMIVAQAGQAARVTVVTNMAGRGTDIRLPADVKAAGGLDVLILDALDSDRLDRQLFGRAGRQGDPGSYAIAHSLDERALRRILPDLMRRFFDLLLSWAPELAGQLYFLYVGWRRRRLERLRRIQRRRLLKNEDKRHERLQFTRRR